MDYCQKKEFYPHIYFGLVDFWGLDIIPAYVSCQYSISPQQSRSGDLVHFGAKKNPTLRGGDTLNPIYENSILCCCCMA